MIGGGSAKIEAIDAALANPKDMADCLNKILKHEIDNSKEIDKIVNLAHEEKIGPPSTLDNGSLKNK